MPSRSQTIDIRPPNRNLYSVVQQEVELGATALSQQNADMAITFFRSALQKITIRQPFHDHLVHNLLLSYNLLIAQKLDDGDFDGAQMYLRSALGLEILGEMADDEDFRDRFAGGFQDIGLQFFKRRHHDASIECFRKSIAISASPGFNVNLMTALAASGRPALLSDFTSDLSPGELGRHIFIACVPKSGSTFLKNVLVGLTGYRDAFMVYSAQQFEQELYPPMLVRSAKNDTVTQQHCRATDANVQMMQAFGIRPVVLVRNIFDSVMSLLDFYTAGASYQSFFRDDFQGLDDETKIDLLIDNFVPWYFQFVSSWSRAEKHGSLEIMWLSYEGLIADKSARIQDVLRFYGLGASQKGVDQRIKGAEGEKSRTRFNKGVAGRGVSGLNERQKEKIRRLTRYYPTTDFSRIGL